MWSVRCSLNTILVCLQHHQAECCRVINMVTHKTNMKMQCLMARFVRGWQVQIDDLH